MDDPPLIAKDSSADTFYLLKKLLLRRVKLFTKIEVHD